MLYVRCFPNDILAEDKGSLHSHLWPLEFQKDSTISRVQEMKPGTKSNQLDPGKDTSFVLSIHPHRAVGKSHSLNLEPLEVAFGDR